MMCLSKSPNKHSMLFIKAHPIHDDLAADIENGKVNPKDDFKSVVSTWLILTSMTSMKPGICCASGRTLTGPTY